MFYTILDKLERRAVEIFVGKQAWRQILARHRPRAVSAKSSARVDTGAIAAE
jgi:hypothetical protein